MSDDLVKRLRDQQTKWMTPLLCNAADRIEELESKVAKAVEAMIKAHAEMRAHGWHLAPGSDFDGDGSQEIAVAEIEAEFSDLIAELTADRETDATTAA